MKDGKIKLEFEGNEFAFVPTKTGDYLVNATQIGRLVGFSAAEWLDRPYVREQIDDLRKEGAPWESIALTSEQEGNRRTPNVWLCEPLAITLAEDINCDDLAAWLVETMGALRRGEINTEADPAEKFPRGFQNGWNQLRVGDAQSAREDLKAVFGVSTDEAFRGRRAGKYRISPGERMAITQVFENYGITENIWGGN